MQEIQHHKLLHLSSLLVPTACSKGKRKGILHGDAPLLMQVQGSTVCCPGGYDIQFTCSNLFSGCISTILSGCPYSGEKGIPTSATLLLPCCPNNIECNVYFCHIGLSHHVIPDYLIPRKVGDSCC